MKFFLHQWTIGLQVIILWMCLTYSLSGFFSETDLGLLYSGIYCISGLGLILLMVFGVLTKAMTANNTLTPNLAFVIKGIPIIFLLIQVSLRIRSELIQSSIGLQSQLTSFAIYTTAAIAVASIMLDWYQISKIHK